MWDRAFVNRLRRELPVWVEQGWVAAEGQSAILDHVAARAERQIRLVPIALAVMGVLVFGTGIVTFFAANWDALAKPLKLALLFGGMWGAYAVAARGLVRQTLGARVLGQALTLLGVILFGANIMLIAQIYHIDSHYPNGVLLWALGALAVALTVPAQVVAVAGLALATLWSGMEIGDFDRLLHWPFLVVWALFLMPVLQRRWRIGMAAAMLALMVWCLMTFVLWPYDREGELIFLLQVYLLAAMAFFAIGAALEYRPAAAAHSVVVRRFALVGILLSAHGLVYDDLYGLRRLQDSDQSWGSERLAAAPVSWIVATLIALALAVGLAAWQVRRRGGGRVDGFGKVGLTLLAGLGGLMLVNLFLPAVYGAVAALYIVVNLVVFAGLVWLIVAGYRQGDRFQVNAAFVGFALGMLALYFNHFWTLMDRSIFFMGGGALLFVGGYLLERQRRRLIGRIGAAREEGGAP
jgi:uncharacterized membrane protein